MKTSWKPLRTLSALALLFVCVISGLQIAQKRHPAFPKETSQSDSPSGDVTGSAQSVTSEKPNDPSGVAMKAAPGAWAASARTPRGEWAERVPPLKEYTGHLPTDQQLVLEEFKRQFPDLDPSDVQHFAQAEMRQRSKYGETLEPSEAAEFTEWLKKREAMKAAVVEARAKHVGIVLYAQEPDSEVGTRYYTLVGFEGPRPVYVSPENADAARATNADQVRMRPRFDPFVGENIDGFGLYVNVNDSGTIYDENPEFQLPNGGGTRVIYKEINNSGDRAHMTHVAGTIGAAGYNPLLMGMAPRVWIRSLWSQDSTGITGFGMLYPGQKHTTTNPRSGETEMKTVVGSTSIGTENPPGNTGLYYHNSATFDSNLRDLPYYCHFFSAGNSGASGYATLNLYEKVAKNLFTIANVYDVARDVAGNFLSGGEISWSSSRGPAFDGRIKPDFSANGSDLLSPDSPSGYSPKSGTSMATPNASGSTLLLIHYITEKFKGHFFRSSTIKALLANSTDELGNAGPDYIYGWGLINLKAAVEIVRRYAERPARRVVVEDELAAGQLWNRQYLRTGTTPVRVTLAWIDPPGPTQSSPSDTDRSPRLVNDLNLRLVSSGTVYHPYVMPFTIGSGTTPAYSTALYGAPAVTGTNFTDNVEQVLVANPPPGTYTLEVSHRGTLQNNLPQKFSLAVSGLEATEPVAPTITASTPTVGNGTNEVVFTVTGSNFVLGSDVILRQAGRADLHAYGEQIVGNRIECRADTASMAKGYWDVVVRIPDGTEAVLRNGFLLPTTTTLYSNNFETGANGITLGTGWAIAKPDKGAVAGPSNAQEGSFALVTYPGGNYPINVQSSATLPVFSTIGFTSIKIEMQSWLGLAMLGLSTDYGYVQYSLDGRTWTNVSSHRNTLENAWSLRTYTLPAAAENKSAVYVRFTLTTDNVNQSFGWNIDNLRVTGLGKPSVPPTFTSTVPTSLMNAGTRFSYTAAASDPDTASSALVFAATGLPANVSLTNNGNGTATLSGTPSISGIYRVNLSVSDGSYTAFQPFTLTVLPAAGNSAPTITTTALPVATTEVTYNATLEATDADRHPLVFSMAAKPVWLTFTDNGNGTATLSGTPSLGSHGTFDLSFSVSDGFVTTQKTLALVVNPRSIVGFSSPNYSVNENGGSVTLTVTRIESTKGPLSIQYATANGTATGADYTATSGTLRWSDGDSSPRTITIPIFNDTLPEIDEAFTVSLFNLSGEAALSVAKATVTIIDDEKTVVVTADVIDDDCGETSSNVGVFRLTRTGGTANALTVRYALSGKATNGSDYQLLSGTTTIAPFNPYGTITINPIDDSIYEGDETVVLTVLASTSYQVGSPSEATIILKDNDSPTVSVVASTNTISENAGSLLLTFSRTGPTDIGPLTVNYSVAGTALPGDDYGLLSGSLVIETGSASRTLSVPIVNDALIEAPESLIVSITADAAYTIGTSASATVFLLDDNEPVVLSLSSSDTSASEPGDTSGTAQFTLVRAGNPDTALSVNLRSAGSALAGSDYVTLPSTVTFAVGQTSATLNVVPLDDSEAEPDETVTLLLLAGNGYSVGSPSSFTVNLYDDEPTQVRIEVTDGKCIEQPTPDNGVFRVTRLGLRSTALSVAYTVAGTARNGTDCKTITSPLTINANSGFGDLLIIPEDDSLVEGPETVDITLLPGANYTLSTPKSATLDIREDETVDVSVSVSDAVCIEQASPDPGSFRFSRSASAPTALIVLYTIAGTATAGTDYLALSGTAIIPANATTVDVQVMPINDSEIESSESVIVTLAFDNAKYDLGDSRSATLWIRDDEVPTVNLAVTDPNAAEPEGETPADKGTWSFTVSPATATDLTLVYSMTGNATNGADYALLSGTTLLRAGQTTVTLDLVPLADELAETAETATLTLQPSTQYNIGNTSSATVTIAESDAPVLQVRASEPNAAENPLRTGRLTITSDRIFAARTDIFYLMAGSATNGSDYTALSGTVSMPAGTNTATVTITPINDTDSEGPETASLRITDSGSYTLGASASALVTIADDESDGTLNFVVNPAALSIPEGSTASFTVKLDKAPSSTVSTTVAVATGDPDITIKTGTALSFTTANWNTPQTVTLSSGVDADRLNGTATVTVSAAGLPSAILNVSEIDKDAPPTIEIVSPTVSPLALPDISDSLLLIAKAADTVGTPSVRWSQSSGPGTTSFSQVDQAQTRAKFSTTGTYSLRATATDADGQTATATLTVLAGSSSGQWSAQQIGATSYSGSAAFSMDSITLDGAGGILSGTAESGFFATTPLSGDFTVTARVVSLQPFTPGYILNAAARAGLVVRETGLPGTRLALATMAADRNFAFSYRTGTNSSIANSTTALSYPHWVRLVRAGNSIQAFRSPDGITWNAQGTAQTISMNNPVLVGFAASSGHPTAAKPRAILDNISGLPSSNGAPQVNLSQPPAAKARIAAALNGVVTDEGQPVGTSLTTLWTQVSGPAPVSLATPNTPVTQATFPVSATYLMRLATSDGIATVSEDFTVTVADPPAPVITAHPQPQRIAAGQPATFSVAATATSGTLSYQWRKDGYPLLGAIAPTFSIESAQAADAGAYSVVVTANEVSTISNSAALEVYDTFDSWIARQTGIGSNIQPSSDPDQDGLPNILEFALGGRAGVSDNALRPSVSSVQVNKAGVFETRVTLTFTPRALAGLRFTVQSSSDLVTWTDHLLTGLTLGQPYTFTDQPPDSGTKRFLRLKVSQQP